MSGFDNGGSAPPPPPPPSAGGGGAIPPRGLGDILSTAFDIYRGNAAKLITIVAVVVVPLTFIGALLSKVLFKQSCDASNAQTFQDLQNAVNSCVRSGGRTWFLAALAALISVAIQQLLVGALTRGGGAAILGRPVDVKASYEYAFSRLGGLILLALLVAVVVGVGFLLFFIPGIIFMVFLAVAVPAFIVERLGVTESMSRSWNLVRGNWWFTFGVGAVTIILAGIVNGILSGIGGGSFVGYWIFSTIAQLITAPFVALVFVILYLDLRVKHEGMTGDQLAAELDRTT